MSKFTAEELSWAGQTAAQLRYLQANCADITAEEREAYLTDEIHRSMRSLVPDQHARRMEALAAQFPTGEGFSPTSAPAVPASAASIDDSPEALVERLVQIAPALSRRKLQELGMQLQQAGYLEVKTTTLVDTPPDELLKRFPMPAGSQVDIQRTYRLLIACADFVLSLDLLGWNIWRTMAPRSTVRRDASVTGDFRQLGGRYLAGDSEVSLTQVTQIIDRLRQLIAGLIGAIGPAGRNFSQRLLTRFAPDAIKDLAAMDGGFAFGGADQKCWRKYTQLAKDLSEDSIEAEIVDCVVRYSEGLIRGTANNPNL